MKTIYAGGYKKKSRLGRFIFTIILLGILGGGGYYLLQNKPTDTAAPKAPTLAPAATLPAPSAPARSATARARPPLPAPATNLQPSQTTNPQATQLYSEAKSLYAAGQINEAHQILQGLVGKTNLPEVYKLLGEINMNRLVSSMPMPGKEYYTVQSGDYLAKIAKKYNTTVALIKAMNGLSSDMIRLGNRYLVFKGTFSIKVSKSNHTLDLLLNGQFFKRYIIGTGREGRTPTAAFTIVDKIMDPPWTRPTDGRKIEFGDPDNPLGTRWLAIKSEERPELTGFGIHGTWARDSVGKQSSNGCIRMLNEEVEEVYNLVPRHTTVNIVD